jgi:hypothetical protein
MRKAAPDPPDATLFEPATRKDETMAVAISIGNNNAGCPDLCPLCNSEFDPVVGPWPEITGAHRVVCIDCARKHLPDHEAWRVLLALLAGGGLTALMHTTIASLLRLNEEDPLLNEEDPLWY